MPDDNSLLLEATREVCQFVPAPLSADEFAVRSKLCGRGICVSGHDLGFCSPPPQDEGPWIAFTMGGATGSVQANWGQLRRYCDLPVEGLSPQDAGLILEDAASGLLDAFEDATGLAVKLTAVDDAPSGAFPIGVAWQGFQFRALLSEMTVSKLAEALPYARAELPDDLAISLSVEIDALVISTGDLASLETGDAIMRTPSQSAVRLIAQDNHWAKAIWSDQGLTLAGGFEHMSQGEQLGMANDEDVPVAQSTDDLDVRISVRAGEALMTLGELKKLGPGSILPMHEPDGASVDLVVNGRRVGTGALITVGGTQAVEIKEMFGNG